MWRLAWFAAIPAVLLWTSSVWAWSNGPPGNAFTDEASECDSPSYSTHDWIADRALALLPATESAWLVPHKTAYLLGTEAPDNRNIPTECTAPHSGYDDRNLGHSVEWRNGWTEMYKDRAARRARQEYNKAVAAYQAGNESDAAFYLGAMAHYVGDASQYGHAVTFEQHHGDYESWVKRRTTSFDAEPFASYIVANNLVRRTPYTAVKRISKATGKGKGKILSASEMDELYSERPPKYLDSIGHSLNLGANELAHV